MPERTPPSASAEHSVTRWFLRWLPVAAWCGVIFALSSLPGSDVPGRWSLQGHFGEYAVLGLLAALCLKDTERPIRAAISAIALSSLYAISDELHQVFVPGRVPDVADWAMDTAGAASALVIFAIAALGRNRARRLAARTASTAPEPREN